MLITFIHSLNLVYRIFIFEIYSFVTKIAIEVIRAELLGIGKPILGLTIYRLELTMSPMTLLNLQKHFENFFEFF